MQQTKKQTKKQTNTPKKQEGEELQVIVLNWQWEIQTIQMSDIYQIYNTFIENYHFAVLLRSLGR